MTVFKPPGASRCKPFFTPLAAARADERSVPFLPPSAEHD